MPDVEFFVNVGDWPLETKTEGALPILSWCGSTDTRDIVLPTYEVTHSTLETMRGVTNDLLSVQGNTGSWTTVWKQSTQNNNSGGARGRAAQVDFVSRTEISHADHRSGVFMRMWQWKKKVLVCVWQKINRLLT